MGACSDGGEEHTNSCGAEQAKHRSEDRHAVRLSRRARRPATAPAPVPSPGRTGSTPGAAPAAGRRCSCLLYTSDAADDLLCVDLGGRRIIKKKKQHSSTLFSQT